MTEPQPVFSIEDKLHKHTLENDKLASIMKVRHKQFRDVMVIDICQMIIGTPASRYFQPAAAALLKAYSSDEIHKMSEKLCAAKVFRPTSNQGDNGRQYAYLNS